MPRSGATLTITRHISRLTHLLVNTGEQNSQLLGTTSIQPPRMITPNLSLLSRPADGGTRSRFAAAAGAVLGRIARAMRTDVLAIYFREIRKGYGYTQQSFAAAAGVGKRTIERLEREEGPISRDSLERIIAAVGASPDEVNYLSTSASATHLEASELAQAFLQRTLTWRDIAGQKHLSYEDQRLRGVQSYVRRLREARNISRKTLAEFLGVSIAVLANWEDGQSNGLALPVVARAIKHLGGTLEDLEQIGAATENHQALGLQLAKAQAASDDTHTFDQKKIPDAPASGAPERTMLQRIAAIEALLQFIVSILQRVAPAEAAEMERIASRWLHAGNATDEDEKGRHQSGR